MRQAQTTQIKAREQIMLAARHLFAKHGIDGVTLRQIVEASGQKNHGSVSYYFGTKEALVRELVAEGAMLIDTRRNARLDKIEEAGGPRDIAEVVEVLVYPSIRLAEELEGGDDNYIAFAFMMMMNHRELFMAAVGERWNSGYTRCLDHLRHMMPDMPPEAKNQRFVFMGGYLGSILSLREIALMDRSRPHKTWSADSTLDHFVQTICAMLEAPYEADHGDLRTRKKMNGVVGSIGVVLD
ncbi:MAG TPA: helix-turn-helix domain-containing protein [Rhizomicrobium sp.]|nr:helix-turn-helix domain-containing protein [Rhizomicrobium sp.]